MSSTPPHVPIQVGVMREEALFLNKVLRTPELLSAAERERLIAMVTGPGASGGGGPAGAGAAYGGGP